MTNPALDSANSRIREQNAQIKELKDELKKEKTKRTLMEQVLYEIYDCCDSTAEECREHLEEEGYTPDA